MEMELREIDKTYTPVNVKKKDMDKHLKQKKWGEQYYMLSRRDEHRKDTE